MYIFTLSRYLGLKLSCLQFFSSGAWQTFLVANKNQTQRAQDTHLVKLCNTLGCGVLSFRVELQDQPLPSQLVFIPVCVLTSYVVREERCLRLGSQEEREVEAQHREGEDGTVPVDKTRP